MKILIVDDSEDARLILKKTLESVGHTVEAVTNGEEALKVARKSSPDMIISDILMPVMDGYLFCKEVKGDDKLKHIPFVFHTSTYTDSGDEELARGLGADRFIIKPVAPDELIKIIQSVFEDVKKDRIKPKDPSLKEDKEIFKLYSKRLVKQLEQKMVALKSEVAERKQAEKALRESEEHYRLLVENANDAIFVAQDERIKFPNFRTEQMTGYSAEELAKISFTKIIHPDYRDTVLDRYKRRLKGEKLPSTYDLRIISKSGEELWVQINATLITWEGRPATLNFFRDITQQKKLEAQLLQSQKMEAIGVLTGAIAHDFNNILTTIIGNAHLALMEVGKDNLLREEIEAIKAAGEKAATLTRQLLTFSRKQTIQPEIMDLNKVLLGLEKMLERLIGEDVEFKMVQQPALWRVKMDPGQMEQILMNLVVNARDAMPRGGKLTVETANVDLDEVYFHEHGVEAKPGPHVMLATSDTGIGMDKETQFHIYEPFFTTKNAGKGTGLGLSTVYGIVKQNNGLVWVYSEPGQGTTFKVYLPKVKEGMEPEEKERNSVGNLGGSETVLIVEDDDSLRKIVRTVLKQRGYKVLEAENGKDALRISKEHEGPIDLLITDVVMPKMNGREVAERLQPLYPQMKVIYMSGYTNNAIAHHGVLAPGLNFIEKPFSPESLTLKVREVLDN